MDITLKKAELRDCEEIHDMQVKAFTDLLKKYQDYGTNPAAEDIEKVKRRMEQSFTDYYFIRMKDYNIGVIRIVREDENTCRISPLFIQPEYQGKGYAQQAILQAENLYAHVKNWELDTIKQEKKLCYFYEKMGYRLTGKEETIQEGMDIVFYKKNTK